MLWFNANGGFSLGQRNLFRSGPLCHLKCHEWMGWWVQVFRDGDVEAMCGEESEVKREGTGSLRSRNCSARSVCLYV